MILDSVTQLTIYHNNSGNHNKVWGYFNHGDHLWAFWGGVGKAWSFKYHGVDLPWIRASVIDLSHAKFKKGYSEIHGLDFLDQLDPGWRDRFNERFTYFLLQQTPL
jgi:hypothetical protein